jgi:hypothetical protein
MDWIYRVKDRDQWMFVMNTVKKLWIEWNVTFLRSLATGNFMKLVMLNSERNLPVNQPKPWPRGRRRSLQKKTAFWSVGRDPGNKMETCSTLRDWYTCMWAPTLSLHRGNAPNGHTKDVSVTESLQLTLREEYHLIWNRGDCNHTEELQFKNYSTVVDKKFIINFLGLNLNDFAARLIKMMEATVLIIHKSLK